MDALSVAIAVFTSAAAVVVALGIWHLVIAPLRLQAFYRAQGIRGYPWRPLVGDIPRLAKLRKTLPEYFIEIQRLMVAEHGYISFFWLGPDIRLRLCDAPLAREVLMGQSYSFEKADTMRKALGPILGVNSMLLTEGEVHKRHRRIASSAFVFDALKELIPLMCACASRAVDSWLERAARKKVTAPADDNGWVEMELHSLCSEVTLSIVGRAAFAADDDIGAGGLIARTSSLLEASVATLFNLTAFIPGFRRLPLPAHLRMDRQIAELRKQGLAAVVKRREERRKKLGSSAGSGDSAEPSARFATLLDLLLDARDAPPSDGAAGTTSLSSTLSDPELLDNAVTFLLAGHETTAQAVTWALYLLAKHPEWQTLAREEVWRVCGRPGSTDGVRLPTAADLAALPTVASIVLETLRLYPAVPQISRVAAEDVVLLPKAVPGEAGEARTGTSAGSAPRSFTGPLRILKGTSVVIPIAALHRDKRYWAGDPDSFDPTRFPNGQMTGVASHPLAFIPFSAGPRNCIGSHFALLEAKAILTIVLQRMEWRLSPNYTHKPVPAVTLRPGQGMLLLVRPVSS